MKRMKNLCLALVVASLLALPAAAQKGARNNNGAGKQRGQDRAEQVQNENKKGENSKSKGSQNDGKHKHKGRFKKGKHEAKSHN